MELKMIIKKYSKNLLNSHNNIITELFNLDNFLFFDIETTGFSAKDNILILIGFMTIENDQLQVTQYFIESNNEYELLIEFMNECQKDRTLVSYNGKTFDIPYLNKKFEMYNIDFQIDKKYTLDIYNFSRRISKEYNLTNSKLKTIETFLEIAREDTISGKESIDLYFEYERTKSEELLAKILLHNTDDIFNMYDLLKIFDYTDNKDMIKHLPLSIKYKDNEGIIENISEINNQIVADLYFGQLKDEVDIYGTHFQITTKENKIEMKIPIIKINEDVSIYDVDSIDVLGIKFNELENAERIGFIYRVKRNINIENLVRIVRQILLKI